MRRSRVERVASLPELVENMIRPVPPKVPGGNRPEVTFKSHMSWACAVPIITNNAANRAAIEAMGLDLIATATAAHTMIFLIATMSTSLIFMSLASSGSAQ